MTMITPSLVPSSDPLVTAASVLEFALGVDEACKSNGLECKLELVAEGLVMHR